MTDSSVGWDGKLWLLCRLQTIAGSVEAVGDCKCWTKLITCDVLETFRMTGTKLNQNTLESGTFGAGMQAFVDTQLTLRRPLCSSSPNLFTQTGTQKCCAF